MKKTDKKSEKLLKKIEKGETQKKIGQRLGKLIDKKYKSHTDFIRALDVLAKYGNDPDNIPSNNNYLTTSQLSKIIHGGRCIYADEADYISRLLNVPIDYLLCKTDALTDNERVLEAWINNQNDKLDRRYESTFSLLSDLGIKTQPNHDLNCIDVCIKESEIKHVDYPAFWFLLENIRNNAKRIFEDYLESSLYYLGAKDKAEFEFGPDYWEDVTPVPSDTNIDHFHGAPI